MVLKLKKDYLGNRSLYKSQKDNMLEGTEPIVWALRDINSTLEKLLLLIHKNNRE